MKRRSKVAKMHRDYDIRNSIPERFYWGRSYAETPKQLVILCHGAFNNGFQMYNYASSWVDRLPDARFVAPTSPFPRIRQLRGLTKFFPIKIKGKGFVWYQIRGRVMTATVSGVRIATEILNNFIDAELQACSLPPNACALVGFSQGGVIALSAGLRRRVSPKAIIAISGALMDCDAIAKEIKNQSPTLIIHSEDDTTIPVQSVREAEKTLIALGVHVEAVYRKNMVHDELDEFTSQTCVDFLAKAFL